MLAFIGNLGLPELVLIAVIAVLIFGKDLPQAASKAYIQVRKLRGAVDDLRRESGIDHELRDIERTVREAEWEARRAASAVPSTRTPAWHPSLPSAVTARPAEPAQPAPTPEPPAAAGPADESGPTSAS